MQELKALLVIAYIVMTFLLLKDLWTKHPKHRVLKKLIWSLVLLVPIFGWIAYGGFYDPLKKNPPGRGGTQASGWATHLPKE